LGRALHDAPRSRRGRLAEWAAEDPSLEPLRVDAPQNLGLLASRDDGNTWQVESLYGSADLHILRPAGATLYAVNFATNPATLMITNDYGRSSTTRQPPGQITDLAVDPNDPSHAFALTDKGLLVTHDQGDSWRPGGEDTQALAWAPGGPLYLGGADGTIKATTDENTAPQTRGNLTAARGRRLGTRCRDKAA
jgi:hypothetical protein